MGRIDVEHKAEGISLTLASHGFSMCVELSQSEADDLAEQLILLQPRSTIEGSEGDRGDQVLAEQAQDHSRAGF